MHSRLLSTSTCLLSCAVMVVLAIAGPISSIQDHKIHSWNPSLQGRADVSTPSPAVTIVPSKRAIYYHHWLTFPGFNVYYTTINSILPAVAATNSLLNLYNTVAANAAPGGWWRNQASAARESHLRINSGHYQLDFFCEQRLITWDLVNLFAQFMVNQSRRGFVSTYSAMASFALDGAEVHVMLNIR